MIRMAMPYTMIMSMVMFDGDTDDDDKDDGFNDSDNDGNDPDDDDHDDDSDDDSNDDNDDYCGDDGDDDDDGETTRGLKPRVLQRTTHKRLLTAIPTFSPVRVTHPINCTILGCVSRQSLFPFIISSRKGSLISERVGTVHKEIVQKFLGTKR